MTGEQGRNMQLLTPEFILREDSHHFEIPHRKKTGTLIYYTLNCLLIFIIKLISIHIINMKIVRLKSLGCCRSRMRTGAVETTRTTTMIKVSELRLNRFTMLQ